MKNITIYGYRIYMEDNHYVILDKRNQLIAIIHMTSNIMLPLTLKPTMKRKIAQAIRATRDAQDEIAFKAESEEVSVHCSKEGKFSAHRSKKEECNGVEIEEAFQSEV
jgi:hypothetical protein